MQMKLYIQDNEVSTIPAFEKKMTEAMQDIVRAITADKVTYSMLKHKYGLE